MIDPSKIQTPLPDVQCIQSYDKHGYREVADRIHNHNWALLAILVKRIHDSDGDFEDEPTYIIGLRK